MELPPEMKKRPSDVPQLPIQDEINAQESEIEFAKKILGMLALTQSEELTCDEVFALLDQYVDLDVKNENVASIYPLVRQHLDICGDCLEEYIALKKIMANMQ
jgi:hypothetical protein